MKKALTPARKGHRTRVQQIAAHAEMQLLVQIADRTGLSTDVLLGLIPMPGPAKRQRERACRLRHIVGCAIEALGCFDADDGHALLIRAGLGAELKEVEGDYLDDEATKP